MKSYILSLILLALIACNTSQPNTTEPIRDSVVTDIETVHDSIKEKSQMLEVIPIQDTLSKIKKNSNQENSLVALDETQLSFNEMITGCAQKNSATSKRGDLYPVMYNGKSVKPNITIKNNSLTYERTTSHLCNLKAQFKKEVSGNNILIKEVWTGFPARCDCSSYLSLEISDLPKGKYTIKVIQQGKNHGEGEETILVKNISI